MFRRMFVVASLIAAVSATAFAFGPRPVFEPDQAAARMAQHLELDEATEDTIEAIVVEAKGKAQPLGDRMRGLFEDLKAERAAEPMNRKKVGKIVHEIASTRADLALVRMDALDEVASLLDDTQRAKFDAWRMARIQADLGDRQRGLGDEL